MNEWAAADLREKTGGHANGNGHGRGDGPSMGTTSCPFAALSMALDGNEGNEGMFQKIPSAGPSGKIPMMKHDLPTIDQFTPSSFDDEEEEDEENGIPVTCPMTGACTSHRKTVAFRPPWLPVLMLLLLLALLLLLFPSRQPIEDNTKVGETRLAHSIGWIFVCLSFKGSCPPTPLACVLRFGACGAYSDCAARRLQKRANLSRRAVAPRAAPARVRIPSLPSASALAPPVRTALTCVASARARRELGVQGQVRAGIARYDPTPPIPLPVRMPL